MNVTFLGTGTSHGVPSIDCVISGYRRCRKGVCQASAHDPKHARTRCSVLLEYNDHVVIADISLDFRQQALRERIPRIDAALLTHRHMDHVGGIPDFRSYTPEPVDVYGSQETLDEVRTAFAYAFNPDTYVGGGITRLRAEVVDGPFELFGETVTPVLVEHGVLNGCLGFRIGPVAYVPDMKRMAGSEKEKLRGVSCLILNCLRDERPHETHMLVEESTALAREIAPEQCWFVHMCHDIHYQRDAALLDPWMGFAYDGLRVDV